LPSKGSGHSGAGYKWVIKNENGLQTIICNPLIFMAHPAGFEPAAYGFEDRTFELLDFLIYQ